MTHEVETPEDPSDESRRRFFWLAGLVLGGIGLLEYTAVAVDFLRPRRRRSEMESDTVVRAGPIERFEPDSVTAFPRGKFYLARQPDGGFLALSRECTHLGCVVPWVAGERQFVCPCHASRFGIDGDVVSPPAPRPLDLYPVRIENGIVKVDTSAPVRREACRPDQVTSP